LKETANTLIRQLMLDTRQFSLLVGEVLPDGTVTQVALFFFFPISSIIYYFFPLNSRRIF